MPTYTCPMHPEVRQDKPGMCPECGMALVRAKNDPVKSSHGDHGASKHEGHSLAMFARKFWISLALTIPIVILSDLPNKLFGIRPPAFTGSDSLIGILGTIVFFYGGWVFLAGAYREIRGKMPGMMTLIGIAISAAFLFSIFQTARRNPDTLYWELTTLITIMLLGHYLEMRAVQGAQGALKELTKLLPDIAEIILGGETEGVKTKTVPLDELKTGDLILVRPGGKIPADGVIIEGSSDLNESMITGESKPVNKKADDKVIDGTINGDGSLKIRVTEIGDKTFLAGVMRLVKEAQASKSRLQILSDRAAFYLTIIALSAGAITFISWLFAQGEIITATERLVAVLVIACPHALGLAVPLVASISTTKAARNGLLIKQRLALEAARTINTVLFDKTGTLTKGEFGVEEIIQNARISSEGGSPPAGGRGASGGKNREILRLAASVDSQSEHFIAKAIVNKAKQENIELFEVKNFQRIPGKGVKGIVNGDDIIVGSETVLGKNSPLLPSLIKEGKGEFHGKTVVYVIQNKKNLGAIILADTIRDETREAIKTLKDMGLKIAMITGDSEDAAKWVAKELEIDEYFARVLPEQKADKVKLLQSRGLRVAMVGDGVNDAPALTQADLGIAIGAGTNVAIESAGIILVKNDPRDIPKIIRLSKLTYSKMIQNLWWAAGYNIIALPLAAGILAPQGILLQPAFAAILMSLSTVIVAFNAVLLKKQKI